ncbi:TIM barrel protein [Paenibacillus sp. LMG 31460]|uniref:TIM barrel protein n=1 Tax=Paenibacillus germinis TaxID=2654979 RepID=A0ABX1Z502_9BACL|nr:sugar phosphate isomerase/epimerase [Paenibacillus germinis]NOU88308.1 TIM barrel protein [Paenibacillus germinis]
MKHKLAIQLHTLRDELQQDFMGVLRELGRMGWAGVQPARLYGNDPEEVATVLSETGMKVAGIHIGLDRFEADLEGILREAEILQTRDLVCSIVGAAFRNEEGYRKAKALLNEAARKAQENGMRISYHNHSFELETTMDGKSALEFLLEPADNNLVLAEPDVYWVKKGGRDPYRFLKPYSGRIPIIHLKDMTFDDEQTFAEIGTGSIDFLPILRWGEENGIEWYVVEQDQCSGPPMDSVRQSYRNLIRLTEAL